MSALGPETYADDIAAGRVAILYPGGDRIEVEKMVALVIASGDTDSIRLMLHPSFLDELPDVARQLAAELNQIADAYDEGDPNLHVQPSRTLP